MADMNISDIYQSSTVPLPKIPPLVRERTWDAAFTHESLPDSNLVLAVLGHSVLKACVTEWLIDADLNVTQAELEARTEERTNEEILAAFADVYALPSQLRYAKVVRLQDRFSLEDRVRVFQAYIGALEKDRGFEEVKLWVYSLMEWDNMTMLDMLQDNTSASFDSRPPSFR